MAYLTFDSKPGEYVALNISKETLLNDGSTAIPANAIAALDNIQSIASSRRVINSFTTVDTLYDQAVLVSPHTIFSVPLHREVCRYANNISEFVWGLREALDSAGAFSFLDNVKDPTYYEGTIERMLAVFSLSATGVSDYSDAPPDFIHAVVDFFRSDDGCGWNVDLLGDNPIVRQCVSNIIIGLAKVYEDDSLLEKSRKRRLPSEKRNVGWHTFCNSNERIDRELHEHFQDFIPDSDFNRRSAQMAVLNLSGWLKDNKSRSILEAATSSERPRSFTDYLKSKNDGKVSRSILTVAEACLKVSIAILKQLASVHQGQTFFDFVTRREVGALRNAVKKLPKKHDSSRARPLPEKMIPIMREILEEGEQGWLGTSGRFVAKVKTDDGPRDIYCPVIPTLFLVMLEIPLRMAQIRRLDSGEGDIVNFDGDTLEWKNNSCPLAGYWEREAGEGTNSGNTRGYARELQDQLKSITSINVNTNKTGDPYIIPWFVPKVLKLLWDLRKWQEAHNPIKAPVGPNVYLDDADRISERHKEAMPYIFPIARLMPNDNRPFPGRIATHSEIDHAWGWLLTEIERRWNLRHPGSHERLVEIHPVANQPWRHRYNIHGLRVRGLTNLRRGGMPLDLLSKFVAGHATLRMTLYYTVAHPSEVADAIEKAVANSKEQRLFIDDMKKISVDEAKRRTVSLSETALPEAFASGSKVQFCNVNLGVCPYDGTRCWDGGKLLRKDSNDGGSKSIYGSVSPRNCVMCRHFFSGPPWLSELLAYGNKHLERRQFLAREESRINGLVARYEEELMAGNIEKSFFENKYDSLQAEIIQVKDEQEANEDTIFNIEALCNASVQLMENSRTVSDKVMLVANPHSSIVVYEEISEFSQAVWITAMGTVHQILGDERVEAKRDRYLDLMLANSGITPPRLLTNVTPEHTKMAMDQYALFINARASANEVDQLVDGTLALRDLGIHDEVHELITTALSGPVPLHGIIPKTPQPLLGANL